MRSVALLKLLESVKLQSLYPDEVLIIDGSTDDKTKEILNNNNFEKLKYFKVSDENRGLTKQRNYGISRIGEDIDVVCFLDDDTVLKENYFKELINTYKVYPEALGVNGYIVNEVEWKNEISGQSSKFNYNGWSRTEGSRFKLRKRLGLIDDTPPGYMPSFSNGRSVSFLPPSDKIYSIEQMMGGVASYKKEIFKEMKFSKYFEGYGLYEDADFSLRLAKKGSLYINTKAKLEHHHDAAGRPNQFSYGKMVVRNGWYVWRIKYSNPNIESRVKWNLIAIVLMSIRFINVITTSKKKEAFTEGIGRLVGLISLLFNKPKIEID